MKKIKLLGIIIGTLVIATASISAVSMKLTTVSFGMDGETQSRYTLMGFYERGTTVYSGETYYLKLDNGTFTGWFAATNGHRYNISGTYVIEGRQICGAWRIGQVTGWISGTLGV